MQRSDSNNKMPRLCTPFPHAGRIVIFLICHFTNTPTYTTHYLAEWKNKTTLSWILCMFRNFHFQFEHRFFYDYILLLQ